jgi:predicted SAM-dependent methyltransferase
VSDSVTRDTVATLDRWLQHDVEIVGNTGYPELRPTAAVARRLLPPSFALQLRLAGTRALRPIMHRRARKLSHETPLRLHCASGRFRKQGWVNLDLVGAPVDLAWDLRTPLPFPAEVADAVFHEHVLEHFGLGEGIALLRECHRVLRIGGVLRVGVPDAGAYTRSYAGLDDYLERVRPGRPTRMLALQEIFQWDGHRSAYDSETLRLAFRAAGFEESEDRDFGDSRIEPAPDGEHRRKETLYVEAVKR